MTDKTPDPCGSVSSTELGFCACIGPMFGEPHCYCEMVRRGLPLNEVDRAEDEAKLLEALSRVFGVSGTEKPKDRIDLALDEMTKEVCTVQVPRHWMQPNTADEPRRSAASDSI